MICRRLIWFMVVLLVGGLVGAVLVRVAPGFGTDERMLDARLSNASIQAIARERSGGADIGWYYVDYLGRLLRGDLGTSVSLGRPVRELLGERMGTSVRSAGLGLALAWTLALAVIGLLELCRNPAGETLASVIVEVLLCIPVALLAVGCFYLGGAPALAVAAILFPRIFRYGRALARQTGAAPHVLAAHASGESPWRILGFHVMLPIFPELAALAGVTVNMAVGAIIPVEALCDSPGVGALVWQAALARDLPVLVNVTLLVTAVTLASNFAADVARNARWDAI
ncbi:MAG: ABC transporter permease subunit [Acidobacteriia bacterium]|nr:ABC transporter permease subunit [Terriglobia bacterium]